MKHWLLVLSAVLVTGVPSALAPPDGFTALFNGRDLSGWKLRNPSGHSSWSVKDGVLINDVSGGKHGTDLVTEKVFKDFVVRYEYRIPKGANSGVYLRGRHEIQILDDYADGKGKPAKGGNGAIYNQTPVSTFASKPAGEWQAVEATIVGNRITVTLNGVKVHERVESNAATGGQLDSKVDQPGPIMLQGDHGSIEFRNLMIQEVKAAAAVPAPPKNVRVAGP